jgi:type VI secretion system protein ImpH
VTKSLPSGRRGRAALARLEAEPQRFTFDAAVRVLTFHRRRADPAGAARFTSVAGSSYSAAEVQVQAVPGRPLRVTVGLIGLTSPVAFCRGTIPMPSSPISGRARSRSRASWI